jgi:Cytidylyltransferase family
MRRSPRGRESAAERLRARPRPKRVQRGRDPGAEGHHGLLAGGLDSVCGALRFDGHDALTDRGSSVTDLRQPRTVEILVEIERDRGVKDFGQALSGQGGVLDRIDWLCFAGPICFHLIRYFTRYFFTP